MRIENEYLQNIEDLGNKWIEPLGFKQLYDELSLKSEIIRIKPYCEEIKGSEYTTTHIPKQIWQRILMKLSEGTTKDSERNNISQTFRREIEDEENLDPMLRI